MGLLLRRTATRWRPALTAAAARRADAAPATLSSSTDTVAAAAVAAFYDEFNRYAQRRSSDAHLTMAAAAAMRGCLEAARAAEALEVYEAVCRCGVVCMSTHKQQPRRRSSSSSSSSSSHGASAPTSLEELAQCALRRVPHRRCLASTLDLLMAAEVDSPSASLDYPDLYRTARPHGSGAGGGGAAADGMGEPALQTRAAPSATELQRIQTRQRLHTLSSTRQLREPLGKEYCLVSMMDLCSPDTLTTRASPYPHPHPPRTTTTAMVEDMDVALLRALSHVVLHHPFTYERPSTAAAQQAMHWEVMSSRVRAPTLAPADVTRLTAIDHAVATYRALCGSSLVFMAEMVPTWDSVLLRRVAETLVLPSAAHSVFPEVYRRERRAVAAAAATACDSTAWTDAAAHSTFGQAYSAGGVGSRGDDEAPLRRVEYIVRRRVHHDIVVPDTMYVLQYFDQLRQLARHREVVLTHSVFLDLVAAALSPAHPTRLHARRVLLGIMRSTTTAVTAKEGHLATATAAASASRRRHQPQPHGFTLLGLQDELALLERCPERFYLAETSPAADESDRALMGEWMATVSAARGGDRGTGGRHHHHPHCCCSAVLVAKQLERVIAAHDRGNSDALATDSLLSLEAVGTQADVDSLVQHILVGHGGAAAPRQPTGALFENRLRGRSVRTRVMVATTHDDTRVAAFTVGLSMYPPASVAPQ